MSGLQRGLVGVIVTFAALTVLPAAATAEGPSIAAATPVPFGQQQFGNIANGPTNVSCNFERHSATQAVFWSLGLTAADRVTIDWENLVDANHVFVYTPEVTDFNLENSDSLVEEAGEPGKHQFGFQAPATGRYALEFCVDSETAGPYSFTAYAQHAIVISLGRVHKLARSGSLSIGLHTSEGGLVTDPSVLVTLLAGKKDKPFKAIGTAAPAADGSVVVPYKAPRRFRDKKHIRLQVVAQGPSYKTETTKPQKVKFS